MFNFQTNLKKYHSGNQKFKAVFMRITKCVLQVNKRTCLYVENAYTRKKLFKSVDLKRLLVVSSAETQEVMSL